MQELIFKLLLALSLVATGAVAIFVLMDWGWALLAAVAIVLGSSTGSILMLGRLFKLEER
jgi:hypothetical protein